MSLLNPRKVKYRKWQRGRQRGVACRKNRVAFGAYGLKATTGSLITARQLEAARRAIIRFVQRGGKTWVRIFPDKPITLKGSEVRMGGGKGAVDHYVAVVKPGTVIIEIDGLTEEISREALRLSAHKLPVKTVIVKKEL